MPLMKCSRETYNINESHQIPFDSILPWPGNNVYTIMWRHLLFSENTQFNWSTLWVISQLEHIKFTVINSLLRVPMVNIDV